MTSWYRSSRMRCRRHSTWFLVALMHLALAPFPAFAEGRPFVISSTSLPADPNPETTNDEGTRIDRLKQAVVLDYLRSALGARFQEYASQATPEFSEGYILDYKVSRKEATAGSGTSAQLPVLELTGHLDVDGLNRWVRLNETKARGSASLRPIFVFSSDVPGVTLSPGSSGTTARTTPVGQTFYAELSKIFRKFNTELGLMSEKHLLLAAPAESPAQMSELRDYATGNGNNSVAWVHLQACKSPGCGLRAEIHTYNLAQGRRLFVQSANLKLGATDFHEASKIRTAIEPLMKDYSNRFEEAVSKGTLFSSSYRLIVRGIDQYRNYKKLQSTLSKLDYLVQSVPKRMQAGEAEFQVLSPLSSRDLGQRLQLTSFPGFQLTTTSAEGAQVEVRMVLGGGN